MRILVNICQHYARGKHACMLPIHDAVAPRYTSRQHAHRRKTECKIRQRKYVTSEKLSLGEIIMTCLHYENTWKLQKQGIATYFITSFEEHPF